jgi:hypothetical protein
LRAARKRAHLAARPSDLARRAAEKRVQRAAMATVWHWCGAAAGEVAVGVVVVAIVRALGMAG